MKNDLEIVDIVDEKLNRLYQKSKQEAHKKGLLHRTVIAEVINSQGEWLLVKQAADRQDPGKYVSPVGGHMRAGESEIDSLKRETEEELGFKKFTYKRIGQVIYDRKVKDRQENHYFIIYEIYSDQKPMLNDESIAYKLFNVEKLKKQLKNNRKIFGDAFFPIIENFYQEFLA